MKADIEEGENVLVKSADGLENYCIFQTVDGSFIGSNEENCAEKFSTSNQHLPSNFVCKKDVACSEVLECGSIINGICNLRFERTRAMKYEAMKICESMGAYLPRITNQDEYQMLTAFMGSYPEVWISLTSRVPE